MGELMQGVTILSEHEYLQLGMGVSKFFFVLLAITIGFLILFIISTYRDWNMDEIFTMGFVCFGMIALLCLLVGCPKYRYKQYKVLIDDTASFVEINEKYEIVDQDGLIYTLKSKEQIPLEKKE